MQWRPALEPEVIPVVPLTGLRLYYDSLVVHSLVQDWFSILAKLLQAGPGHPSAMDCTPRCTPHRSSFTMIPSHLCGNSHWGGTRRCPRCTCPARRCSTVERPGRSRSESGLLTTYSGVLGIARVHKQNLNQVKSLGNRRIQVRFDAGGYREVLPQ